MKKSISEVKYPMLNRFYKYWPHPKNNASGPQSLLLEHTSKETNRKRGSQTHRLKTNTDWQLCFFSILLISWAILIVQECWVTKTTILKIFQRMDLFGSFQLCFGNYSNTPNQWMNKYTSEEVESQREVWVFVEPKVQSHKWS